MDVSCSSIILFCLFFIIFFNKKNIFLKICYFIKISSFFFYLLISTTPLEVTSPLIDLRAAVFAAQWQKKARVNDRGFILSENCVKLFLIQPDADVHHLTLQWNPKGKVHSKNRYR